MSSRKSKQKQKMRGPSRPVDTRSRYTARRVVTTRRGPDPFALWLLGISTALAIIVVFWLATSGQGNNNAAQNVPPTADIAVVPTPLPGQATTTAIAFATQTGSLNRISPEELRALMEANNVKIVDVRVKSSYDVKHIKGAVSVPEQQVLANPKEFPREGNIVVYCQ
jgi:hypothetical protein